MSQRQQKILNESGFTLLEVMIAIAILAFIVTAIVSVTGSSQDTAIRVVEEDRQTLQVETAMSRLEWDISQLYSPLYFSHAMEPSGLSENAGAAYNQMVDSFSTNERFAFPSYEAIPTPTFKLEDKNTFTFFTTSNRRKFKNSKQSHFAWVRYQLLDPAEVDSRNEEREEPAGSVLVRKFSADDVFNGEAIEWDKIKAQVLLRDVEKLVFEFWNEETRKWTDNLSTIKNGIHLVRGIKLTMEWIDSDGIKRTFIRVFRPLFPNFKSENMYKLIKEANAANSNQGQQPPGGGGQTPEGQEPGGEEE